MPELEEKAVEYSGTNVTLVTTAETVIISSGAVKTPRATCVVLVSAWCQLTTGALTTAVTPRVRRGTNTSGPLVGEANAVTIGAAAGSTEVFSMVVSERRANEESVEYSLTLAQTGATGNGTVLQAAIAVEVLGG